ncbi:hypothetical protein GUJ93_ZPchr0006g41005 [Zizania palustris]|uniref:Uncharacterized protein n=1 Tax=Zizania palustris TaxID=103762 RepID=A0A8J5VM92_ZIZPA|nr:hypothetical protein GUJ93_ZPchr0006g41005 [Zizania palustris]
MVHVLNMPVDAVDAWEAWPAPPSPAPDADQQQQAISMEVSNQQTSDSVVNSKATHSPPVSPERNFPLPQITAVFKRRARQSASATQLSSAASASALGLRRSTRLRNKQRGFRVSFSRKQCPNSPVQGPSSANPASPELPANPTVEDFAQASVAAQVTEDELRRDPRR